MAANFTPIEAGTSTPAAAYHDAAATMPHQNPIMLDDRGEALVHITQAMLWRLETPTGVQLWEVDNIGGWGRAAGDHPALHRGRQSSLMSVLAWSA